MPSRSVAGLVIMLAAAAGLAACDGGDADTGPAPSESADASPTCITAGSGVEALRLDVPTGFADGSQDSILDEFWARPAADGSGSPDVVALDAYDRDAQDHVVVQRAMAAGPVPSDSGVPTYDRAVDRVARERLTAATWTAPDRDGAGEHTGFVTLERTGDTRFTITIVASTDVFEALKDDVLATVRPGDCTD